MLINYTQNSIQKELTMSIMVLAEFSVKPEKFEEAWNIITENLPDTLAWDGCHSLETFSHEEESKYIFVGKWESKKVYNEYLEWRSKTSAEIFAELGASADPLKVRYCEIKSL